MPTYRWYIDKKYLEILETKDMTTELEDLEKIYVQILEEIDGDLKLMTPAFLLMSKKYVAIHERRDQFQHKLYSLMYKLGKGPYTENNQDEECGECEDDT